MTGSFPRDLDPALAKQVADRCTGGVSEILEAWSRSVRGDPLIATDDSLCFGEFADNIPRIVEKLCELLIAEPPDKHAVLLHELRSHGLFRWRQGYDLEELLREISHLRIVLMGFVARAGEELDAPPAQCELIQRQMLWLIDEGQISSILTYLAQRA